ncbi:alpha/beta fold hydrolase [Modestobacter sp. I12A-02628]|uniref:Alpha/beta fold hydrolase n=1 Tax=Goekera deserti TaxID=2497753 RepID=A0A7K3WIW7_9ACTN|nr:alpha/beta fold hydrolase [Goekera deserti]NDI46631.1 alpha/beta fold hydrolase [Goekera deserti]NEL56387.1 alpha/beta fold hydrolase [Goekera deserti]
MRLVDVRGRRVRYRDEGSGPVVLLLHGIARSLEDWDPQVPLLAGRYRVLAPDLAGYGESEPLREPYSLPTLARSVEDLLDALGIDGPVHVAGNSLGGAVAMQLSVQAPPRVRTLTLVNSAGFGREVTATLRLLAIRPLARLLLRRPTLAAARHTEQSLFADPALATDERVRRGYRFAGRPHGTRVLLETASSLGGLRGVHPHWRRELLDQVRAHGIPTLVTWGDADRVLPATHLDGARRDLAHARTHLFPGTGHMPQIERADEFAELVQAFWDEHPG